MREAWSGELLPELLYTIENQLELILATEQQTFMQALTPMLVASVSLHGVSRFPRE
jgi:hypothetical protein